MYARLRSTLGLGLILLPLVACAGAVRQPEVRLESVRVGSIGVRGGLLYVDVHVTNPNRFDLETRSVTYDFQVPHPTETGGWISFAQGEIDEPLRIQRRGSTIIPIPIQFRYDDLGGAVRSIIDTGTFNYRVRGDVRLSEPVSRTIPYSRAGIVTLSGAQD